VGIKFNGVSSAAVVNANSVDSTVLACTDAMLMTNSGENTIKLNMEGNTRAVTSSGWGLNTFYLGQGEQQTYPHLSLVNGAHDNTLYEPSRAMRQGSPTAAMSVDSSSQPNSEIDSGAAWFGVSSTVPGRRFLCLNCIGPSANYVGDLANLQIVRDLTGQRPPLRITDPTNGNTGINFLVSPGGPDSSNTATYGLWFSTDYSGAFDKTKAVATIDLTDSAPNNTTDRSRTQWMINSSFRGTFGCGKTADPGNGTLMTDCSVGVSQTGSGTLVYPVTFAGDGTVRYAQVLPSAANLPACVASAAAYNQASVGTVIPNYPFATSQTYGAAPGSGGNFNVMIRCDFDGTTYSWRIH
jgi:hypothetical protein